MPGLKSKDTLRRKMQMGRGKGEYKILNILEQLQQQHQQKQQGLFGLWMPEPGGGAFIWWWGGVPCREVALPTRSRQLELSMHSLDTAADICNNASNFDKLSGQKEELSSGGGEECRAEKWYCRPAADNLSCLCTHSTRQPTSATTQATLIRFLGRKRNFHLVVGRSAVQRSGTADPQPTT
ncbi:hypothetical protein J6590_002675 [Homalodisca vitripennis]|nr:hypothetical protein J6590_002675 [Homalodisca vitripennis]